MRTRTLLLSLTLTLALTAPPVAFPQPGAQGPAPTVSDADDWQGLGKLKPGKRILVEFKDAAREPLEGKFVRAAGARLFLYDDGDTLSVEQRDVERIYRVKGRWSRGRVARIGMGVGMLVGTFIGVERGIRNEGRPCRVPSDADTAPAFVGFGVGAAVGAGTGALLTGRRKGERLYLSK